MDGQEDSKTGSQPWSESQLTSKARSGGGHPGSSMDKPKKRVRRTAGEINRRFTCECGKAYGSEGSLNQHKKNKNHFSDKVETSSRV